MKKTSWTEIGLMVLIALYAFAHIGQWKTIIELENKVDALETQNALLLEKVDQQEEIIDEYKYQEWYELHCTLSMIECVK